MESEQSDNNIRHDCRRVSVSFYIFFTFFLHSQLTNSYPLCRHRLNQALIDEGYDINHDRYPEGYQEAPLAYDAVWSVALAFNKTMERLTSRKKSLRDFTYTDKEIADDIYAAMNSTQFLGVSVRFGKKSIESTSNTMIFLYCSFRAWLHSALRVTVLRLLRSSRW